MPAKFYVTTCTQFAQTKLLQVLFQRCRNGTINFSSFSPERFAIDVASFATSASWVTADPRIWFTKTRLSRIIRKSYSMVYARTGSLILAQNVMSFCSVACVYRDFGNIIVLTSHAKLATKIDSNKAKVARAGASPLNRDTLGKSTQATRTAHSTRWRWTDEKQRTRQEDMAPRKFKNETALWKSGNFMCYTSTFVKSHLMWLCKRLSQKEPLWGVLWWITVVITIACTLSLLVLSKDT